MADFSPAFATDGERRNPNPTEVELGFQCGAGQRELFNGMFYRIESELGHLLTFAGLTPSDADNTQVRQAIEALIAAATGGGDTSMFVLMAQARLRLPIYPDVQNIDGVITVTAPGTGVVRVPGGIDILHRGIFPVSLVQTDFNTDPSKIYHLRWNKTDGLVIKDLASLTYNPSALAETNPVFDSKYDDMLIARVVTNSSNVAAITNLANKVDLEKSESFTGAAAFTGPAHYGFSYANAMTLNWGRIPRIVAIDGVVTGNGGYAEGYNGFITTRAKTRYSASATVAADWNESQALPTGVTGYLNFSAVA